MLLVVVVTALLAPPAMAVPAQQPSVPPSDKPDCTTKPWMTRAQCSAFARLFEPNGRCSTYNTNIGLQSVFWIGEGTPLPCVAQAKRLKKNPAKYCYEVSGKRETTYLDGGCRVWSDCSSPMSKEVCLRNPNCVWDGYCHAPCTNPSNCDACFGAGTPCCTGVPNCATPCDEGTSCNWCRTGYGLQDFEPCCLKGKPTVFALCDQQCVRRSTSCPLLTPGTRLVPPRG